MHMRTALSFIAALLLPITAMHAAAPGGFFAPKTKPSLLLDHATAKPGSTVMAGVKLAMADKWHTYWRNPGQNGKATEIKWTLPAGITAGTIQWPVPHKTVSWEMYSFEFSKEVILLVPLTIADSVSPGTVTLKADLDWLECETEGACVPGTGSVEAKLNIGAEPKLSPQADELKKWAGYLPKSEPKIELIAYWEGPAKDDERNLVLEWKPTSKTNDFFSFRPTDDWQVEPPTKLISRTNDKLVIRQAVTKYEGGWPKKIEGIIVDLEGHPKHPTAINVAAAIQDSKPKPAATAPSSFGTGLFGGLGGDDMGPKVVPELSLSSDVATPGSTVNALVKFTVADGWHTYWRNPGQFADAVKFKFQLPAGITVDASAILWPIPEKKVKPDPLGAGKDVWNYELAGEFGLIIPLQIAEGAAKGTHEIGIETSWIECEAETCVPGEKSLSAKLVVGDEAVASAGAGEVEKFIRLTPESGEALKSRPTGAWESQVSSNQHSFVITAAGDRNSDFFAYEPAGDWTIGIASEHVDVGAGKIGVRKVLTLHSGALPDVIPGIWVAEADGRKTAHEVNVPITGAQAPGAPATATPAGKEDVTFLSAIFFAFLGGLILNVMPCVLPIISLKVLSFVNQAKESPARVKQLGIIYTLGVLASFLGLAALIIGVQKAGGNAVWGMQFSNPIFVVALTTLVTLVALNLFGVFEVTLSSGTMTAANSLAQKKGSTGAFFNGVLMTVLATPCTAPLLIGALGFAFTQPPAVIVTIFATAGLGLASPYLVLSLNPSLLRFLPKPGNWMVAFKQSMGFPMMATAFWLLWVSTSRFGRDGALWIGMFLVVVSLCAWIWGEFVQRGTKRRGLAIAIAAVLLVGGYLFTLEMSLHWRAPLKVAKVEANAGSLLVNPIQKGPDGIKWYKWSHAAIAEAQSKGHPVFVDFTADWCATCKLNKRSSVEIDSTKAKLKELNFIAMIGDNTQFPEDIKAELLKFRRPGVPLNLVYPADPTKEPEVLPNLLTPGTVHEALERAAGK